MAYALKLDGKVVPLTGMVPPDVLIDGAKNTIVYEQEAACASICSSCLPPIIRRCRRLQHAARAAVLPAQGADSQRAWLQESVPRADRAVHRCGGIRRAQREEELHSHCASGRQAADSLRHIQYVLSRRSGIHQACRTEAFGSRLRSCRRFGSLTAEGLDGRLRPGVASSHGRRKSEYTLPNPEPRGRSASLGWRPRQTRRMPGATGMASSSARWRRARS